MDNLSSKTVKELLAIAKEYQIVGRHDMKKQQLIDAIVESEKALDETVTDTASKSRDDYIKNLKSGDIVAFRFYNPSGKKIVKSAKVVDAHTGEAGATVQDKFGNQYFVYRSNILYVKIGKYWPRHIYFMFKGEFVNEQQRNFKNKK